MELKNDVAGKVAELSPAIKDAIISKLAEEEIKIRKDEALTAITQIEILEKEIRKIKPDQESFDAKGDKVSETYSKQAIDNRNKKQQALDKWNAALKKALEEHDWKSLKELVAKTKSGKPVVEEKKETEE